MEGLSCQRKNQTCWACAIPFWQLLSFASGFPPSLQATGIFYAPVPFLLAACRACAGHVEQNSVSAEQQEAPCPLFVLCPD